jgi:cell wall-associated NlpC family hydrolase
MRLRLVRSARCLRAFRAARLASVTALLPALAARAQDAQPASASPTSIAVPGSKLSNLLGAAAAVDGPKPFARFTASAEAMRDSVVALARAQIGKRYVRGGASPDRGFDCSGLVKYVLGLLDISAPRTARLQDHIGEPVARDTSDLEPGDLLTFGRSEEGASHVAIYVGDGRYVHASVTAGRVIETTFDRRNMSLLRVWRGVRRIFESAVDSVKKGDG